MLVVTCPYFLWQFFRNLHKILRRIVVQDFLVFFFNVKAGGGTHMFHANNHKNSSFNPIKLKLVLLIITNMYCIQLFSVTSPCAHIGPTFSLLFEQPSYIAYLQFGFFKFNSFHNTQLLCMFQQMKTLTQWSWLFCLTWQIRCQNSKLEEVFSWKIMDFDFPTTEAREKAIKSKNFIPENNQPLGLAIWKNKLFVSFPPWKPGVVATLTYIDLNSKSVHFSVRHLDIKIPSRLTIRA